MIKVNDQVIMDGGTRGKVKSFHCEGTRAIVDLGPGRIISLDISELRLDPQMQYRNYPDEIWIDEDGNMLKAGLGRRYVPAEPPAKGDSNAHVGSIEVDVCDCGEPFPENGYCKFCGTHRREGE